MSNVNYLIQQVLIRLRLNWTSKMAKSKKSKKRKGTNISINDFKKKKINIKKKHFSDRWKERVDTDYPYDFEMFIRLMSELDDGITKIDGDFYLLNQDVVAVCVKEDDRIDFLTVYGSITKNPFLYNVKYFPAYYKTHGNIPL